MHLKITVREIFPFLCVCVCVCYKLCQNKVSDNVFVWEYVSVTTGTTWKCSAIASQLYVKYYYS